MTDAQRKMMKMLGLTEEDFKPNTDKKTDKEKLAEVEKNITELQLALCDLYESVGVNNE